MCAFSAAEGKLFFEDWLRTFGPEISSILDIGPGAGIYGEIARKVKPQIQLHAIEVFEPYIQRFDLSSKYDFIQVEDVTKTKIGNYDLIIVGDVLEHIERTNAYNLFQNLKSKCKFLWLSLPVKKFRGWYSGYNQPESDWKENIYEKHLYNWDYDEILLQLGPFLWQCPFKTIVVLIAEGKDLERT